MGSQYLITTMSLPTLVCVYVLIHTAASISVWGEKIGLNNKPRINFQLVGGPKLYVEEMEIKLVEGRARFRRSAQTLPYYISRPSNSRLGLPSILRPSPQPGTTHASLSIKPGITTTSTTTSYHPTRYGQPSILRGQLRPGTTSASLSIRPALSHLLNSRRGQPSLLRGNLAPGTTSASLAIRPSGRSLFKNIMLDALRSTSYFLAGNFLSGMAGNSWMDAA